MCPTLATAGRKRQRAALCQPPHCNPYNRQPLPASPPQCPPTTLPRDIWRDFDQFKADFDSNRADCDQSLADFDLI